jgi:hypothetical protein
MSRYARAIIAGLIAAVLMTFLMTFVFKGATPYLYGLFTGVFVAYIFGNLAGNRKVATAGAGEKEAALKLQPPAGKALLVVFREGFVAKLAGLNIAVDGKEIAQLTAPKFTVLALAPGAHTLTCAFGGLAGPQSKSGSYEFQVAEGGVAAVGIGVAMGLVQGSMTFTPIADVNAARAKLSRMPMVKAEPTEI